MKKLSAILLAAVSIFTLSGCSPQDRDGWFYDGFVKPMDIFLKNIYDMVGSWGIAIVVITIIMRLIILPFMLGNYKKSRQAKIGMEKAKPELDVINQKLEALKKEEVRAISKEDRQRVRMQQVEIQKEQWAVMKKYNANPMSLGGCLPILIQAPFLTGIYFTLVNPAYSVGIVDSTFLGFNLGTRSYILPIIAFIVYAIQTKLTLKLMPQTNVQPGQEAMAAQMQTMQWITPFMIAFISFTVAGAVGLYYIVGGIFVIGQTYLGYLLYPPYKPEKNTDTFDPNKVTLVSKNKKKK